MTTDAAAAASIEAAARELKLPIVRTDAAHVAACEPCRSSVVVHNPDSVY